MDTDRRERAKSIRAARDWLTGAEHALAGEDDLAGDLKLMLARAELARLAADRRARLKRWSRWLLPPLAAAAVIGWMMWESPPSEEVAVSPSMQTTEVRADAPTSAAAPTVLPVPVEEREAPPVVASETSALQTESVHPVPPGNAVHDRAQVSAAASAAPPAETAASALPAQPRVPNADMQHLMQVGGKILRE